jgi:hypothetical protein
MAIDPVIELVETMRGLDDGMDVDTWRALGCGAQADYLDKLTEVKSLYAALLEAVPTSVMGAGELLRLAARRLPFAQAASAAHLHCIADRLCEGRRRHADLVWLRLFAAELAAPARSDDKLLRMLRHAIAGAARPVLVWRAVAHNGRGSLRETKPQAR